MNISKSENSENSEKNIENSNSEEENEEELKILKERKLGKIALFLSNFIISSSVSYILLFFPPLAIMKGLNQLAIGVIMSTETISSFSLLFLFKRKLHLIGRKKVIFFGYLFVAMSLLSFAMIQNINNKYLFFFIALLTRMMGGFSLMSIMNITLSYIPHFFTNNESEKGFGILESANGLAFIIGPLFGTVLYSLGGYKTPFIIYIGILLFAIPFILSYLPTDDNKDYIEKDVEKISFNKYLNNKKLISMLTGSVFVGIITSFIEASVSIHFHFNYKIPLEFISFFFIIPLIASMIISIFFSKFQNKFDKNLWIFIGILGCSFTCLLFAPSSLLQLPNNIILSTMGLIFFGCFFPLITLSTIGKIFENINNNGKGKNEKEKNEKREKNNRDISLTIFNGTILLGSSIGPVLGGFLQMFVYYRHCYEIFSLIGFLLLAFYYLFSGFKENLKKSFMSNENGILDKLNN